MPEQTHAKTKDLVDAIYQSYQKNSDTIPVDPAFLPDTDEIIEIIKLLRVVLFPGYTDHRDFNHQISRYSIGNLLEIIRYRLSRQIIKVMRLQQWLRKESTDILGKTELDNLKQTAQEKTWHFLEAIPRVRDLLATDVKATFAGDPSARDTTEIIFSFPGILAISIFRLAHILHLEGVALIPRIMTEHAHSITGIDIHPGATIGDHFFIDHGTGVVIGETTVIGNNVKIYQGVTLGALSLKEGQSLSGVKRHPTLEDNVVVYAGASILGGETVIGEGVVIGSNAFITRSVPRRTTVTMKNPQLTYMGGKIEELDQPYVHDWVI